MSAGGYLDACGFTPVSTGTGDFVVSAAIQGYQTPASASAVNATVYSYRAESADKSQWEEGFGAYTVSGTTLARTTVTASSTGAKVSFSAAPNVFITALSADLQNASLLTSGTIPFARLALVFPDVIVEEQQVSGTAGGTNTIGSFITRILNTLVRNNGSIASLATNQVTLGAGTYYFAWSAPAGGTNAHQTRLQNITDGTTVGVGTTEFPSTTLVSRSFGSGVVTIAGSKAFALQHRTTTANATNGLGLAASFGTEVYSRLEITRLA